MSEIQPSDAAVPPSGSPGVFATTRWSVVLAAGNGADVALEDLCRAYWRPVYGFIRRFGRDPEDARDLTQGFFARLLEKNWIARARRERGRFRTFLLATLKAYLSDEHDRATALKRGGGVAALSLDAEAAEREYAAEPSDDLSPDRIYEQRWAEALLRRVLGRLEAEFDAGGRGGRFAALKGFLVEDRGEVSYADTARILGLSESAVKSGIHRLRARYGELVREEISQTVAVAGDVDDEIRHLLGVLGG
jgi:RNA polymerase sigma-70 factor (ECF subfamily)